MSLTVDIAPALRSAIAAIDTVAACVDVEARAAAIDEIGAHVGQLLEATNCDVALERALRELGSTR